MVIVIVIVIAHMGIARAVGVTVRTSPSTVMLGLMGGLENGNVK